MLGPGELRDLAGLASVPVVVALVGLLRSTIQLPTTLGPIAAVVCGVAWNVAVAPLVPGDYYPAVLSGILAGLAAAGLYDVGRMLGKPDQLGKPE